MNQDYDTILPFVDANGRVTDTITIGTIATTRDQAENTWGYDCSTIVKSLVPEPVAKWTGKKNFDVKKVVVKQGDDGQWTQVTLRHPVRIKQVNNKPALPFHLMNFAKAVAHSNIVGTDAREAGPWKKGAATGETGGSLRPLLEAVPVDMPELIVFASENCVAPARATEQKRVAPGCFLACNTVRTFDGQLKLTFGGTTQAEANRDAGVWSIACALDHLKGKLDNSPIFSRLSDELKDAARKARAGEPWKDNLDRYLVRVLSEREQAALAQYREKCRMIGRKPRVGEAPVAPSEKSWDDANKREGRGRHSLVRLSVELEH